MKLVLSGLVALTLAGSAAAETRGLKIEDLVRMDRVGAPVLAPDGKQVLYTLRRTDMEKNRGVTNLWLQDLRGDKNATRQLTAMEASDPEWSPKGDAIYFLSSRSGSSQVWRLPLQGGEAQKVTDYPLDVDNFRLSPQGDRLLVSMSVFRDCADLACTRQKLDTQSKDKASGRIFDRLFVRHWDVWADGRRSVLFSAKLDGNGLAVGAPVALSAALDGDVPSKPDGGHEDYQFSPDGKQVVFSIRIAGKTEAWSTNFDIYQIPVDGAQAAKNLTAENPAWDAKAQYAPDGKTIAYLAMSRPGFEADRFQIMLLDVATGKKRKLAANWDRSAADFMWAPDGQSLLVSADDIGQHRLFRIDLKTEKVTAITGAGSVHAYDVKGDELIVNYASLAGGEQLYRLRLNGSVNVDVSKAPALTHANAQMMSEIQLGKYEQFSFAGAKGETVYGYVMKPWNAQAGVKYPVAFLVHGGPQGSFGNQWGYRWNPQIYSGAGYAAVFIDFHGSTGYGQGFTDAISGDWVANLWKTCKKAWPQRQNNFRGSIRNAAVHSVLRMVAI